jgi:PAS domain S-box-containing protein
MGFDLKLSHKGLILVSVPLVFELSFVAVLATMLHQAEAETTREVRARAIISELSKVNMGLMDAGGAVTGYTISKSSRFEHIYNEASAAVVSEMLSLRQLTSGSKIGQENFSKLDGMVSKLVNTLSKSLKFLANGDDLEGLGLLEECRELQESIRSKAATMLLEQEKIVKESPAASSQARARVKEVLIFMVAFNIVVAFGLAAYFNRGTLRRLAILMDNTEKLSDQKALNPVLQGDDEIGRLDKVFHDMAEKLAEAARKERAIIDNAQDVICSIDASGNFSRVSPASVKVWGYTPEELVGTKYTDLVVPQDADRTLEDARKSLHGGPFESRVRRKDGAIVHMLWSAYWSASENSLFCVAHDITARKRAEEEVRASERRVRQMIDSMPVGLVVINDAGVIQMGNPSAIELFKYKKREIVGKDLMSLFDKPNEPDPANFMNALYRDSIGKIVERTGLRQDGSVFPMELSLKSYDEKDGRRFLAIMLDVTERHEVDRLKQEFLAMVSHDLRSPLTSLQAFLMMLNEGIYGELTPKGSDKAAAADRSATRLLKMVNDLLDLDKLQSGNFQMEFTPTPIADIIERSADALRATAESKGVVIETPPTAFYVLADGDRLIQVVVNLLGNAIKYSPAGEPVTISAKKAGDMVEVRVTDRGRGVPQHLKESIFERFKQVDVSDHKEKGGSGLGLAIAKAFIEQHGGEIGVESEDGKGSSFWFRVPFTMAKSTAEMSKLEVFSDL